MNDGLWFICGLVVGSYPAYLYGRAKGIAWATKRAKELFEQAGLLK